MKKTVIIIFILSLLAGMVSAQVRVGAKAGLNISNIIKTGDDDFSSDFKTGVHAGLYVDINLVDRLSFAPELMFSQKGYKARGSSILGGAYDYTVTTNFIDLPILLKMNAAPGFSIYLGPQVSFLMKTTEKFEQGSDAYQNTVEEDFDNLKKNLIGGVLGIDAGGQKVGFTAAYSLDFQKNNEDGSSEIPLYKNQVFKIGLNIRL